MAGMFGCPVPAAAAFVVAKQVSSDNHSLPLLVRSLQSFQIAAAMLSFMMKEVSVFKEGREVGGLF